MKISISDRVLWVKKVEGVEKFMALIDEAIKLCSKMVSKPGDKLAVPPAITKKSVAEHLGVSLKKLPSDVQSACDVIIASRGNDRPMYAKITTALIGISNAIAAKFDRSFLNLREEFGMEAAASSRRTALDELYWRIFDECRDLVGQINNLAAECGSKSSREQAPEQGVLSLEEVVVEEGRLTERLEAMVAEHKSVMEAQRRLAVKAAIVVKPMRATAAVEMKAAVQVETGTPYEQCQRLEKKLAELGQPVSKKKLVTPNQKDLEHRLGVLKAHIAKLAKLVPARRLYDEVVRLAGVAEKYGRKVDPANLQAMEIRVDMDDARIAALTTMLLGWQKTLIADIYRLRPQQQRVA